MMEVGQHCWVGARVHSGQHLGSAREGVSSPQGRTFPGWTLSIPALVLYCLPKKPGCSCSGVLRQLNHAFCAQLVLPFLLRYGDKILTAEAETFAFLLYQCLQEIGLGFWVFWRKRGSATGKQRCQSLIRLCCCVCYRTGAQRIPAGLSWQGGSC